MRADEAGVELAKALLQSEEHKPITLVGFSFGARIIYSCLKELAVRQEIWEKQEEEKRREEEEKLFQNDEELEQNINDKKDNQGDSSSSPSSLSSQQQQQQHQRNSVSPLMSLADLIANANKVDGQQRSSPRMSTSKASPTTKKPQADANVGNITFSREPASIIEDVVVMGLPQYIDIQSWLEIRRVVAGRLVNCYSKNDWILSLMFQLKNVSAFRATCGTAPVGLEGVENFNISNLVSTHSNYCTMAHSVLRAIGYGEPEMINTE